MATKKKVTTKTTTNDIIDISIGGIKKQKYRINGDKILELNIQDMNLPARLEEVMPKLDALQEDVVKQKSKYDEGDEVDLKEVAEMLKSLDAKMREYIDYIFDSNVSEVCVPSGNMFDLHNGKFTYEHIIEALGDLYEQTISKEYKARLLQVKKHTQKYGK